MPEKLHQALNDAILRLLRPLARIMLNHGMAYGSFAELARKAFTEEGFDYVERSGKRPTISSVSALTGLTRKETKRLREEAPGGNYDSAQRYSRAIRVISGWVSDPRYQDEQGEPALIPVEGDRGSFAALVKEYSGDIPTAAMLKVLQASDNVSVTEGKVELRERAYIPMSTAVDKINILGTDVAELIATIRHNIEVEPDQRFFQRKVSNTAIRPDALAEFREISNRKSQELLEEYHSWLSVHEVETTEEGQDAPAYVAIGIYYFEHDE